MEAGKLRDLISIEAPNHKQDEVGSRIEGWRTWTSVWSEVVTLSGAKLAFARSVVATATHRVTIRFIDGLTVHHRVMLDGKPLMINSVIDPDRRRRQLDLICSEVIG